MYRIITGNTTKLTHKVRTKCCHLLNGYDEQYYTCIEIQTTNTHTKCKIHCCHLLSGYDEQYYTYIEIQTLTQNAKYIAVTFLMAMISNIIHL